MEGRMKIKPAHFGFFIIILSWGLLWLNCDRGEKTKFSFKYELEIKHQPIKRHVGEKGPIAIVEINSSRELPSNAVTLHYQVGETQQILTMSHVKKNIYQVEFPKYKKGTIVSYYIKVLVPDGSSVFLPLKAADGKRFQFSFQGQLSKELKVLFVALAALVLLFFGLSFLLALDFIRKNGNITKCIYVSIIAVILLSIFVLPVGVAVQKIVHGSFFDGWPFGPDVSKTIVLILLIGWILVFTGMRGILLRRSDLKNWFSDKVFAYLVLVGSAFSFIFFLVLLI